MIQGKASPARDKHQFLDFGLMKYFSMPYVMFLPLLPVVLFATLGFFIYHSKYQIPEEIPFWTFLFGLPHIIASFQTTYDKEYLATYRWWVVVTLGVVLLPYTLVTLGVSAKLVLAVFFILTVHHVIAQQFGIALAVEKLRPSYSFTVCKWSTIALGVLAYFHAYLSSDLQDERYFIYLQNTAELLTVPLLGVVVISAGRFVFRCRLNKVKGRFFLTNITLFLLALILIFQTPYALVGLMIVRILHDSTSFIVYLFHDAARNQRKRNNVLYRIFPFIPVIVLSPLLALITAAALSYLAGHHYFIGWFVIGITLGHYYIEKFMWRGGTPHRNHFNFN